MKRFVLAVVLTGIVAVTAVAGNIPTSDFVQPPPPTQQSTVLTNVVLTVMGLIH